VSQMLTATTTSRLADRRLNGALILFGHCKKGRNIKASLDDVQSTVSIFSLAGSLGFHKACWIRHTNPVSRPLNNPPFFFFRSSSVYHSDLYLFQATAVCLGSGALAGLELQ
jgi:hypothetical protein